MPKPVKIELYRDGAGEYRWRAVAKNGRVVADSGEGYQRRSDAEHGARLIAPEAPIRFIECPPADPPATLPLA